ncbi:MAG TPA: TRAM domain-containing protein [Actinomycetes bacterium]|nr:TRAM domain-containing protein [Actinomycetes bacterium]
MKRPRLQRVPSGVVELLRLFVVVFFAGLGSLIGSQIDLTDTPFAGVGGAVLGVIVGSFVGYALGGVLGRSTVAAVDRTEERLRSVSAETIVGGVFGGLVGVFFGVAIAWPIFFIDTLALSIPIFGFAVVALGLLGFKVGASKRDSMIGMFGGHAGMAPPSNAASAYPKILDTSVAIDGRIVDVVRAGFLHGEIYLTTPVIGELQGFADAGDDVRRSKGRRGLEVLEALKREPGVDVVVIDDVVPGVPEVDAKLVRLAIDKDAALLTLDTNLAKAAGIAGVRVLNLHALALALRPPVTAGDEVSVLITKTGKEPGQGVGYLDDGTMVVVERGREFVGHELLVQVTSVLTTANGRLVFSRQVGDSGPTGRPDRHEVESSH